MSDATLLNEVMPAIARHKTSRRRLLGQAAIAAGAVAGSGLLGRSRRQSASAAYLPLTYGAKGTKKIKVDDVDILNFALNLEYLEAEFYQRAAFGLPLGTTDITGTGTQGTVTGGNQVPFADPVVQQYAEEIATDELNHVRFLRAALGSEMVARPTIDFTDAFIAAATSAMVPGAATFDPFSNDLDFLLGSFIFEDVGVTAYQGGSPYIKNSTYLQKAAGILTVEGYHAATVRTTLYQMAISTSNPAIYEAANLISAAREVLSEAGDSVAPTDEGLAYTGPVPNIVPANSNGMTYARTFQAVLNIVYLGGYNVLAQTGAGGFFPGGMNGRIK